MNWRPLMVLLLGALLWITPGPVLAVEPDEMLSDPALEARARNLSLGLRCLICQNQTIDDSHSELARDLRLVLRERLVAGDTDDEALAYLVDRYGNYILLKPPFMLSTALLWLGPGLLLIAALFGFGLMWRRPVNAAASMDTLTDEDREIIARTLAVKDMK